ncbi:hypothetical protein GCQ56_05715 [Marinifilum sp. N1E240]|uniref:capsule assembly Wzi family protein n=1 Tax=Marinifilum sp. N1E240 TaxID=2608082 RepID=UPI00128C449A|nr:capsule assembly Wzi family protein [Marinifilum sp. N1E240]MPQ46502.1 hypothetical protein [Marinifilum sp. N1E240]
MKLKAFLLASLMMICVVIFAQKKTKYEVGISSAVGTNKNLPFWLHSNKNGRVPDKGFIMGDISFGMDYNDSNEREIDFMWKTSGVAYSGHESNLIVDEAYVGLKWKIFNLYIGQKNNSILKDGLSSTNGDLMYSNNSRAYPKYELSVSDWTGVPYTNGLISFKGLLSDGITTDNRYIDNARIHHKNFYLRIFKDYKFSASAGIEHYALWAGTHPINGDISGSFSKYMKIFKIEGDDAGTFGNDEYRLGNHIGSYRFDLYYNDKNFSLNAYYQTVFEDGSGKRMNNLPDGLYGLYFKNNKNEKSLIQSALFEFYHTTDQGGSIFQEGDHIIGGRDNYFNHSEYRSGWTHHGRTIGSPLFTTGYKDGHTVIENNRFKAVHIGLMGHLLGLPYKTYFTFSKNYGTYSSPYTSSLNQFSGVMEVTVPARKLPFKIDLACAVDKGELLKDNLGFFIRLSKSGIFK